MEAPLSSGVLTRSRARRLTASPAVIGKSIPSPAAAATARGTRGVLLDVTNDSPIAGLLPPGKPQAAATSPTAGGKAAPAASAAAAAIDSAGGPPDSPGVNGEEALRAQVQALLGQQPVLGVQLAAALAAAMPTLGADAAPRQHPLGGHPDVCLSPNQLLAPTPVNTPAEAHGNHPPVPRSALKPPRDVHAPSGKKGQTPSKAALQPRKAAMGGAVPLVDSIPALHIATPVGRRPPAAGENCQVATQGPAAAGTQAARLPLDDTKQACEPFGTPRGAGAPITRALHFSSPGSEGESSPPIGRPSAIQAPRLRSAIVMPAPESPPRGPGPCAPQPSGGDDECRAAASPASLAPSDWSMDVHSSTPLPRMVLDHAGRWEENFVDGEEGAGGGGGCPEDDTWSESEDDSDDVSSDDPEVDGAKLSDSPEGGYREEEEDISSEDEYGSESDSEGEEGEEEDVEDEVWEGEEEEEEGEDGEEGEEEVATGGTAFPASLCDDLSSMTVSESGGGSMPLAAGPVALRGVPPPCGTHIRFTPGGTRMAVAAGGWPAAASPDRSAAAALEGAQAEEGPRASCQEDGSAGGAGEPLEVEDIVGQQVVNGTTYRLVTWKGKEGQTWEPLGSTAVAAFLTERAA